MSDWSLMVVLCTVIVTVGSCLACDQYQKHQIEKARIEHGCK